MSGLRTINERSAMMSMPSAASQARALAVSTIRAVNRAMEQSGPRHVTTVLSLLYAPDVSTKVVLHDTASAASVHNNPTTRSRGQNHNHNHNCNESRTGTRFFGNTFNELCSIFDHCQLLGACFGNTVVTGCDYIPTRIVVYVCGDVSRRPNQGQGQGQGQDIAPWASYARVVTLRWGGVSDRDHRPYTSDSATATGNANANANENENGQASSRVGSSSSSSSSGSSASSGDASMQARGGCDWRICEDVLTLRR